MATLNDFNKVDDSDDVMAAHVNDLISASLLSEYQNVETLSGTRTLLDVDTPLQLFDCNGANRIAKMPTADTEDNHPYVINNVTASGSYTLTIQNNGGTVTYALLAVGDAVMMIPDGEGGYLVSWLGSISWGEFTEQASAPATPSTGKWKLYFKSDGPYYKDDAGAETGPLGTGNSNGWNPLTATLTYSSADDPIYVVSSNADLSSVLQVGDRIKFTNNSTTFYGIIHALGAWSGSAQLITIYGGTDYDVANSAITAPYYSKVKSPQGFPMAPSKWTVTLSNSSDLTQNTPTQNTVYNPGSLSLAFPIGVWDIDFICAGWANSNAGQTSVGIRVGLSTANNSYSDDALKTFGSMNGASGTLAFGGPMMLSIPGYAVTSKTTHYVVFSTPYANQSALILYNSSIRPLSLKLVSSYL